jgi:predicted nucleic acid-binding protein
MPETTTGAGGIRSRVAAPDETGRPDSDRLVSSGAGVVRRAVEAVTSFGIHFCDGLVVASAERGGYATLYSYSEDLNHGQSYFGVKLVNPYL